MPYLNDGTIIRTNVPPPPQPHTPHYQRQSNNSDKSALVFYIITLVISAVAAWILSGFVSVHIFDPNKAQGWLSGITAFINNLSPYVIFLVGFGGCFWYNVNHSFNFGISEILLSALSAFIACLIAGVALLLLSVVLKIIVIIIIVIVVFSIFFGG